MKTPSCRKLVLSITAETLNTEKENFNVLKLLLNKTYNSKPNRLPECYASLVTHLSMTSSFLTPEIILPLISKSFESNKDATPTDLFVLGALIKSGCLAAWDEPNKNKVIQHLLGMFKSSSEYDPILFDFLLHIVHNEDLFGKITKSDWIHNLNKNSPLVHALFFLHLEGNLPQPNDNQELIVSILKHNANIRSGNNLQELFFNKLCSCDFFQEVWSKLLSSILSESATPSVAMQTTVLQFFICYTRHSDLKFIENFMSAPVIEFLSKRDKFSVLFLNTSREIVDRLKNIPDQSTKLKLIEKIIEYCPKFFPSAYAMKIMDGMIMTLEKHGLVMVTKLFKQIFTGKHELKREVSITDRRYCLQSFSKLISHPKCYDDVQWRKTQLRVLFSMAFLSQPEDTPKELAMWAKSCFFSALHHRFPTMMDYCTVLDSLVTLSSENLENNGFSIPLSSQFLKLWESSLKCLNSISEDVEDSKLLYFRVMISYMMMISFRNFETAKKAIQEIFEVLKQIQDGDTKGLHWNDVMVDLCLSLLSEPKMNYRSLVKLVFGQLCSELTSEGLDLILGCLRGESLTEEDESDGESIEDEADDKEEDEAEDKEEDEESEDQDSDLEPETLNEKLREALRDELYKADTASTAGSVDLDSMDEEEGKKLNQTLGQIFKSQAGMKSEATKPFNIQTRAKVVDLVEILVSKNPPFHYILRILDTLFDLIRECIVTPTLNPLVETLNNCIKIIAHAKYTDVSDVTESDLVDTISKVLQQSHPKNVIIEISHLISLTFLMISKHAKRNPDVDMDNILEPAVLVLHNYFSDLQVYPFHVLVSFISSRDVDLVLKLIPHIIETAFNEKETPSRRTHAMKLLLAFYNNKILFIEEKWSERLEAIEVQLLLKCKEVMTRLADKSLTISISYGASLFDLLTYIKRSTEKHSDEFSKLESNLPSCVKNFPSFSSAMKKSFNRFCITYNMPDLVSVNLKRKSEDISPENELQSEDMPKKKKRLSGKVKTPVQSEGNTNKENKLIEEETPSKVKKQKLKKKNKLIIL